MAALARAVAGLLTRGGWLAALVVWETALLLMFWAAGPVPFDGAFDRRAAEADLLLLSLSSLPALLAAALTASGDREDGMTAFFFSCRVTPVRQVVGNGLGLLAVLGGALAASLLLSLALGAPGALALPATWMSLGLVLASTAIHGAWGLALGNAARSRLAAVGLALAFWVVTVFAAEALVTVLVGLLPLRTGFPVLTAFLVLDPSQLIRVASVVGRGQGWAYGPVFQELFRVALSPAGLAGFVLVLILHLLVPLGLAVLGLVRRTR